MEYTINHLSGVEKEIVVTYGAEEVSKVLGDSFTRFAKTADVKGFRKGKVPANVIRRLYGRSVLDDTARNFVNEGIHEAIIKEKLQVISNPIVNDAGEMKEGEDFKYSFTVEVFPEMNIENRTFEAEYTPINYKEDMLDVEFKALKRRFAQYNEVERASKEGDQLTVDFEGSLEGEVLENASGKNVAVVLGDGNFVKDFEAALTGRSAGDKFDADVVFPEEYHSKELAGKTVKFAMEVKKVEEDVTPEFNDEFLKDKDDLPDTVEELKTDLEGKIKEYLENVNSENKKYITIEKLVENNEVEIPRSFLEAEMKVREEEWKKKNGTEQITEEARQQAEKEARWASKRFLILSQLARDLQVSVSDEELDASLARDAAMYNVTLDIIKKVYDKDRLNERRMMIQENKVLDKVMADVTFKEVEKSEK